MDIVSIDVKNNFYARRRINIIVMGMFWPLFLLFIIFMGNHSADGIFLFIFKAFVISSPVWIGLIAYNLFKYKYFITSFKYEDGFYEIGYYKYGKYYRLKLEVSLTDIIITYPAMARYENYLIIINYKNESLIKQYTYGDWTITMATQAHKALRFIPGAKLNSVLRFDKEMVQYEREMKNASGNN